MYPLALSGRELLSIFNQCCTFSTVFSIFLSFFLTFCLSQSCEFYRIPVTPKFKLNLSNTYFQDYHKIFNKNSIYIRQSRLN